jgi:hypothetical protein
MKASVKNNRTFYTNTLTWVYTNKHPWELICTVTWVHTNTLLWVKTTDLRGFTL